MRIFLLLTLLLPSLAFAGLVEVNSSQYLRESGNPQAQYLEVTLDNVGEIRVSNVNLQDGYIELAASTDVLLNGSSLLQPFSLPTGGSAVFPLEAGTHYLEVTLRGKPGGGLKVSFYEDKPDAPVQGKGWELLEDGTVLHRKTGLIFHRNLNSPGVGNPSNEFEDARNIVADTYRCPTDGSLLCIDQYISNLNNGLYGEDAIDGNATHTDWRAPTITELLSVIDPRVVPALESKDGGVFIDEITEVGGWTLGGIYGGMKFGEPLLVCFRDLDYAGIVQCPAKFEPNNWLITNSWDPYDFKSDRRNTMAITLYRYEGYSRGWVSKGSVWPVRGGTPE